MLLYCSEAQENADEFGNEVEQLRATVTRTEEEKQRLELELAQVKEMLQREVGRADAESRRNAVIIAEYKQVALCYFKSLLLSTTICDPRPGSLTDFRF